MNGGHASAFALRATADKSLCPPGATFWLLPQPYQRPILARDRIGRRQRDFRNRLQRLGVVLRRWPRDLHLRAGRIGADDAEIAARADALMSRAGGQDCVVARLDLPPLTMVAAGADAGIA